MDDVVPFPVDGEEQTPEEYQRDVKNYIDRVAGREDPKLRAEVRRDMQKSYMRLGSIEHK